MTSVSARFVHRVGLWIAVASAFGGSIALGDPPMIGVYFTSDASDCDSSVAQFDPLTMYVIATGVPAGITGAEFKITGVPAAWFPSFVANPAANLSIGSPITSGVNIAFATCQLPDANGNVSLGTITAIATSSLTDVLITVVKHDTPSNPMFPVPLVTACDAPTFTKVPVVGRSALLNSAATCCVSADICCVGDNDCNDLNDGTIDSCVDGECVNAPTGACCLCGICEILTSADCAAQGGVYNGDNSTSCDVCPTCNGCTCVDGDPCTVGDVCNPDGTCGTPVVCAANPNPCLMNVCNSANGQCEPVPANQGGSCDDGNVCTLDDVCDDGECVGSSQLDCSDGSSCTTDTCDPTATSVDTACVHTAVAPPCDDGAAPTAMCNATDEPYEVDENCEAYVKFTGMITDNCCVDLTSVTVKVTKTSGMGAVSFNQAADCVIAYAPISDNPDANDPDYKVNVSCTIEVSDVTECPVNLKIELTGTDCCGKPLAAACMDTATVVDKIAPTIGTPAPLALCYPAPRDAAVAAVAAVRAVAEDNCSGADLLESDVKFSSQECATVLSVTLTDACDNTSRIVELPTFIDGEAPEVTCPDDLTVECGDPYEPGIASATDNCTLNPPVHLTVTEMPGNCRSDPGTVAGGVSPPPKLTITRNFGTTDNTTPVVAGDGENPCDNPASCVQKIFIVDTTPPTITHCPEPITVKRGDKFCNDDVQRWLDSFTAEDKCASVELMNDAPECGFPAGRSTTVTFTATDECGLTSQCTSTITVEPLERVSGDQKGSLLVFSKVEIRWNPQGQLIQDTFLDFSNDADRGGVDVQAYFVNGDMGREQMVDSNSGAILQEFEPGWNTADCRFHLTMNQPHSWSAARGSTKCQPFTALDEDGPGRLDPDANDGSRILRGFVVLWAVKFHEPRSYSPVAGSDGAGYWEEVRWNDLKGDGLLVNYAQGWAWEYNAYAYQAHCGATGEPLLDCTSFDSNGTCCTAEVIPGRLGMDGFEYDANFDRLLLDFHASGSRSLSGGGVSVMVDTDLTLHSMDIDLRQDGNGPVLTKADFEIYNENESMFSGTRRCICCWDQTLLSNYVRNVSIPNHFLREKLGTDRGVARIDGVCSDDCDYVETCGSPPRLLPHTCGPTGERGVDSFSTPLLGVAAKVLTFSGARQNREWSGTNLHGFDTQRSILRYDVSGGAHELLRGPGKR